MKTNKTFRKGRWLWCALAILPAIGMGQEPDPYQEGLKIIKEKGALEGIRYFRDLTISEDNAKSLYYLGWAFWQDGDIDNAEQIADFCLENVDAESFLAGHCYYLLGNIHQKTGNFDASELFFRQAIEVYTAHGKSGSLFKAKCSLASLFIHEKRFEEAKLHLAEAMTSYSANTSQRLKKEKKPIGLGYYYELFSRIAFSEGKYRSALGLSTLALFEYESQKDDFRSTYAQSTVGFYKIITGQVRDGLEDTRLVQERIDDSGEFQELSYYNGINFLIAARCSKKNFTDVLKQIKGYIRDSRDTHLEEILEFALTWNCGGTAKN